MTRKPGAGNKEHIGAGLAATARRRAGQACPAPGGTGGPGAGQHGAGFDGPASLCDTMTNELMWL